MRSKSMFSWILPQNSKDRTDFAQKTMGLWVDWSGGFTEKYVVQPPFRQHGESCDVTVGIEPKDNV